MSGFRFLHTMLRVRDLDQSIEFYTKYMGMKLLRKNDHEGGRFTLAFLGYGDEKDHTVLELTYNWDKDNDYTLGDAYGHIALGVPDIYATCDALKCHGINITREPGPMKHSKTIIAFIEDPDGYKIELIEV